MSFTHSVGIQYKTSSLNITNTTDSFTADSEVNADVSVPVQSNFEVDAVITVANIKSMVLYSDKAITIKTNSISAPDNTITLAAGKQVVWNTDHAEAKPFTVNVTKLYISNASGGVAAFKMRVLLDQTP